MIKQPFHKRIYTFLTSKVRRNKGFRKVSFDELVEATNEINSNFSITAQRIGEALKSINDKIKPLQIKVKYFSDIEPLTKYPQGDWQDLRSAIDIDMKAGEFQLIPLGVGMKLPPGYEANIVPRSSTFKNFGILQTNSFGVIDNSYSGNNDEWKFPALAMRDTSIKKNDRICQFRLNRITEEMEIITVLELDETDRGGFGSSGVK